MVHTNNGTKRAYREGQFPTTLDNLKEYAGAGVTRHQVRQALAKFCDHHIIDITIEGQRHLITVLDLSAHNILTDRDRKRMASRKQPKQVQLNIDGTVKGDPLYPDWLDRDLWDIFKKYRKDMRRKLTKEGERLAIKRLVKLVEKGYSQHEVIQNAIEMGWIGLYPPSRRRNISVGPSQTEPPVETDYSIVDED